jgi:tripartite-type tricarboxylate transporter receptor subunit TctC
MKTRAIAAFAALAGLGGTLAHAEDWPSKSIRLVFPSAAGGGPERVIRTMTIGLGKRLGQAVVVDYKPGAGGNIGAADLARSAPDGYSWMLAPETVLTINPLVYKNLGYKADDVVPVRFVGSLSQALACNPAVGAKSVAELVALAKTKDLTFASAGTGSAAHMTMEMFLDATKIKMTHVPYRGVAPALTDLLGGQVDCYFGVVSALAEYIRSGRLVGLAVSSKKRLDNLPGVPTVQELGYKDFDATFYLGVFAPRGVPENIRSRFEKALDETVHTPEFAEAMAANSVTPEDVGPEAAQKELRDAAQRWAVVAKRINLRPD